MACNDPGGRVYRRTGRLARRMMTMAKSQHKSNKEARKPKAVKVKTIAANASTKDNPVAMVTIRK